MHLLFDEFKEFLALIETEEDKASVPVFISKEIKMTETGMQTGEILLQYQFDTGMFVVFRTNEGIDPIMLQSEGFRSVVEYYLGKEARDLAHKKYLQMQQKFNDTLDQEYDKAVQALKSRGFTNIIPYTWSE